MTGNFGPNDGTQRLPTLHEAHSRLPHSVLLVFRGLGRAGMPVEMSEQVC